jgi:hypothetical protein
VGSSPTEDTSLEFKLTAFLNIDVGSLNLWYNVVQENHMLIDVDLNGVFDELLAKMQGEQVPERETLAKRLERRMRPLTQEEIDDIGTPMLNEEK